MTLNMYNCISNYKVKAARYNELVIICHIRNECLVVLELKNYSKWILNEVDIIGSSKLAH
jgi:hypothetical protein